MWIDLFVGLWIVANKQWVLFCCFSVVEGGWRVAVADENGLNWFRAAIWVFLEDIIKNK